MSPEQAKNAKSVDHRTDIWSLAMSLYEALAGQKAWQGFNSPGELVLAICTQDVRPIQDVAPWVSPSLADIVHRGMHRDLAQRYASVDELLRALEPHAASCPVLSLEALRALSPHQKEIVAERSPNSRRSSIPGATADSTRDVLPTSLPGKPSAAPKVIAVLASVALVALGSAWVVQGGSKETPARSPVLALSAEQVPTVKAPPVIPISALVVKVPVSPRDATVTVNGSPQALLDGALELTGEPGNSFRVVIEAEGQRREVQVILTSDGKALPASLEGPTKGLKTAAKGPASTATAGAKPADTARPADTKPATTSNPSGLGQQKDWRLQGGVAVYPSDRGGSRVACAGRLGRRAGGGQKRPMLKWKAPRSSQGRRRRLKP
jgi:hypothetical protein